MKLGLAPNATEDEAVAAITKLQEDKAAMTLARITDAVDTAIKEKRLTPDKKEKYIVLGKNVGLDTLNTLLDDMQPAQKPSTSCVFRRRRHSPHRDPYMGQGNP